MMTDEQASKWKKAAIEVLFGRADFGLIGAEGQDVSKHFERMKFLSWKCLKTPGHDVKICVVMKGDVVCCLDHPIGILVGQIITFEPGIGFDAP